MKIKALLLIFILIGMIAPVSALVKYDILLTDAEAFINGTVLLTSESETDIWDLTFVVPDNSEIIYLKDEELITDYTLQGHVLNFKTHPDKNRFAENINIYYRDFGAINTRHFPLKIGKVKLFGFEDEFTEVTVRARDLVAGSLSLGFETNFGEVDTIRGLGKGPVNVEVTYGVQDTGKYEHYVSLTDFDLEEADTLYDMLPQLTGYDVPFSKFVVVGLDDWEYSRLVDPWSDGKYDGGGLIYLREKEENEDMLTGVVLHESVHGVNNEVLKWDMTEVTWFDEGVAKYVEYLTSEQLGLEQAEIFGFDVSYYDGLTRYTFLSRSDPDELWEYYRGDEEFMYYWNPDDEEHRTFGYAFGELVIREFVMNNGIEGLHGVYDELAKIDEEVDDVYERNRIILTALDSDFKPCYSDSRREFDVCLEDINTFVPELPVGLEVTQYLIGEEEIEEVVEQEEAEIKEAEDRPSSIVSRLIFWLANLFS